MFQLLSSSFSDIIAYSFATVFIIIGNLTAIAAKALNIAVFVRPGGNVLIVDTTWTILRDFSNMIFIVLLIYMAFATIFDQGKYTFKDMIVRFVIVAILINFSLVIGNLIIDGSQVLSNIFLGSIGNLGDRLGQYLNPSLLLPGITSANNLTATQLTDLGGGGFISLIFAIILSLIFLFSLLVALVFAIIRVPIVWALLIVSPLAWMSHILPSSNVWWKRWWGQFWGWNLFLPVYLFFMYLGLIFLSQRDAIIGAVIQANATAGNPANAPLLEGLGNSLSFNLVFFYLFSAFVMVGGTWAATKTTSLMGIGFDKGLGWAKGLVKKVPLPYLGNLQATENAYNARKKQFQQEGFKNPLLNKVYGGAEGQARADAKAGKVFGVKSAEFRNAKEQVAGVDKEAARLKDQERAGQIQIDDNFKAATAKESNMSARGIAMRSLLYERGMIDPAEFSKDMKTWTATNPFLAESMMKKAQQGGFKGLKADQILEAAAASGDYSYLKSMSGNAVRKDFYNALIGNKDIKGLDAALSKMTIDHLKEAVGLNGGDGTNESSKFKKAIAKKRPDLVAQYEASIKGTLRSQYFKLLKNSSAKEIAEALPVTWRDPEFQKALVFKIKYHTIAKPALPPGVTVPMSAFPGGIPAGCTRTPDGRILVPAGSPVVIPPGIPKRQFKGKPSGGEDFRASLDKETLQSAAKNKIVARL